MDSSKLRLIASALLIGLCGHAQPASAQFAEKPAEGPTAADKETARNLMDLGRAKFDEGDYEAALDAFQGADKIMGVTSTGLWVGKALEKLGRLVESRDKLLEVARIPQSASESAILREAREEAAALQLDVADRIPELDFVIEGLLEPARPTIRIGESVVPLNTLHLPRKVDPGTHRIVATAPGHFDLKLDVTVAERERQKVTLLFRPNGEPITPPPEPEPDTGPNRGDEGMSGLMITGIVAGSVGAAGLILGAVTGGLSLAKASSAKEGCNDNICPPNPDQESDRDTSVTLAHVSTTGFVIGGVGAAVATVAFVMELTGDDSAETRPDEAIRVTPLFGPGFVGVQGVF
ncbi:MAG TPA: hypothetical protein ENK57_06600 [Polyangiaceae bacterium]|nr:hypothetical protein [Polyangiaceae bacterium]